MVEERESKQRIEEYLKAQFPEREEMSVGEIEQLRVGGSYGVLIFTAHWRRAGKAVSQGLVIRMEPDLGCVPPYDISPQYDVLRKLHGSGIPVPEVYCLEKNSDVLGHPFILMEKIEQGERFFDAYLKQPDHRAQLMKDYISILGKMHGLNWSALGLSSLGVPENNLHYAEKEIARWRWVLKETQYTSYPIMAELFTWLKRNVVPAERTTLCHGDYTVFNVFARDGRVVSIFDWEMVGIGDPVSDIAWTCMFNEEMGLGGWDETDFIHSYEEMTGTKVSGESLFFWKILSYFKLSAITVATLKAGLESKEVNNRLMWLFVMFLPRLLDKAARMLGF